MEQEIHAADPTYLAAQVLRLEQALAAASKGITDRIAGGTSAAVQVEPPVDQVTGDLPAVSLERVNLPEVARLEDVLTVAPTDQDERAAPDTSAQLSAPRAEELERPRGTASPAAEPVYVAAQALREAFWFEQASAFQPKRLAPVAHTAEPVEPAADLPPSTPRDVSHLVLEPPPALTARGRWAPALCILALIALVALLAGRGRRAI